ncbi:MAG: hypothetical protein ABWX67_03515, partial [Allosphingosinicella sp.]
LAAVAMGKTLPQPRINAPAEAAEVHDSEAPARAAALKAAAAEAVHDRALPSSALVIARVRAEQGIRPALRLAPAPRSESGAPRSRKARPAPRARTEPRKESDFLERQGYIY